jgi:hypothetical protein
VLSVDGPVLVFALVDQLPVPREFPPGTANTTFPDACAMSLTVAPIPGCDPEPQSFLFPSGKNIISNSLFSTVVLIT